MPHRSARLLACLLLALLAAAGVRAGVPPLPRLRVLGVREGLPSSSVTALARDRAGYVWIGTADGLARYDGAGFRVWRHVPGDPAALPGNNVQAVHVDALDRVWVATEFGGISMLDAQRRGFVHYRRATHPAIGSDDAWAFASQPGALWFGTADGGLHRLDRAGGIRRWTRAEGLPSDTVVTLATLGTDLWIGTNAGLARWDGHRLRAVPLPGDAPAPLVYALAADGDTLWVGTAAGVLRRTPDGEWRAPRWAPMFARPNAMLALVRGDADRVWIGSQHGLWRVPADGVPVPVPMPEAVGVKPLESLLLHQGGLWAPVPGAGLGHLRSDWRQMAQYPRGAPELDGEQYRAVAAARDGGVWLAGTRGAVAHIDRDGGLARLPQAGQGRLADLSLASVAEDRSGRLWLGHRNGLLRVDGARVQAWSPDSPRDATPAGYLDLLRVSSDGTLWLSAQGAGIQQRDPRTGAVLAQVRVGEDPALGAGDTEVLEFDAAGRPWIAGGGGLARWDPARRRFVAVPGLRGGRVLAFAFDGPGAVWVHRMSGLEHHRLVHGRWRLQARVDARAGLPALESAGLRVDALHRVWLSTRRGLFRWDPRTQRLRHLGVADGLGSQEFIDHALELTRDGLLVATAADGSVLLRDTRLADGPARTPVLRFDGLDVRRDGRWQPRPLAGRVTLRPGEQEWRVRLRLLAYDAPAATRYWSRLQGVDRHWVAQDGGERVFAGLPPGDYTLRVRAQDAAGNAAAEQRLPVRVLPPWWRSGWMAALVLGLAALAVWRLAHGWEQRRHRADALRRIRHERELARAASRAKSDFLADFGHEVRTPMTGVLGMADLLLEGPLGAAQRSQAEAIRGAGRHLLRLVDDALDLARIEAGRLDLVDAPFDLWAVLEEVRALFTPLARAKGLAFRLERGAGLPRLLRGDGHRVRQILFNLCGNALKFTERGHVTLRAAALAPEGVRLEVSDSGPGLDARDVARLFRRFEQVHGGRVAARYGGSGLGLAICHELAMAMGGAIGLDSQPGAGATFHVRLPLPVVDVPQAAPAPRPPPEGTSCLHRPAGLQVLVVEDDPFAARVLDARLRALGHRATCVPHALDALARMQSEAFDLALLDLDLPGMGGLELAGLLRAAGHRLPLLAVTACADPGVDAAARQAGIDGVLRKPLEVVRLQDAIARSCPVPARLPGDCAAGA